MVIIAFSLNGNPKIVTDKMQLNGNANDKGKIPALGIMKNYVDHL